MDIIRRAIEEPLRTIAANGGYEGSVIVKEVLAMEGSKGFDAAKGEYVDMLEKGIIDPKKSHVPLCRTRLHRRTFLTTECSSQRFERKNRDGRKAEWADGRNGRKGGMM